MNENVYEMLKKEFKEEALDKYNQVTSLLKKIDKSEESFNKFIYEFNANELEAMIKSWNIENFLTVRMYVHVLKVFINFCVEKGLCRKNLVEEINYTYKLKEFVSRKTDFISEDEFNRFVDMCVNPQDSVILQLLFEGVNGSGHAEILNLKWSDVDARNRKLTLYDLDDSSRIIDVSQKCIYLIKKADEQKRYVSKNGLAEFDKLGKLVQNGRVVKFVKSRSKDTTSSQSINTRIRTLKKMIGLPSKKASYYQGCGMIALAKKTYDRFGWLNQKEANDRIIEVFNKTKQIQIQKGKKYETVPSSIKKLTNAEIIYEVYNIKFDKEKIKNFQLIDESLKENEGKQTTKIYRIKQDEFRETININYNDSCAITGESVEGVLEASHIQRYINMYSHHPQNGILLRIDFHRLFDKGLITIDDDYKVLVSKKVESSYYQSFHKTKLRLPFNKEHHPSKIALKKHRDKYKESFSF